MTSLKFCLVFALTFLFGFQNLFGQDLPTKESNRKFAISINILPLPVGSLAGFFEWKKAPSSSFVLGCNYWFSKKGSLVYNQSDQFYMAFTLEYRKYLSRSGDGFYLAPYLKLRQIVQKDVINYVEDANGLSSIELPMQDQTYKQAGIGFLVGYQKNVIGRLELGGFAGTGYYFLEELTATKNKNWIQKNDRFSKFDFRLGVCLGIAF